MERKNKKPQILTKSWEPLDMRIHKSKIDSKPLIHSGVGVFP